MVELLSTRLGRWYLCIWKSERLPESEDDFIICVEVAPNKDISKPLTDVVRELRKRDPKDARLEKLLSPQVYPMGHSRKHSECACSRKTSTEVRRFVQFC